jgi:hypothetical protein
MYVVAPTRAIQCNLCKHQIEILLFTTNVLETILLEFCGTYFGSQNGSLGVLFTTPSMDDLILASDDDGNDDVDDKDGEVQHHVDVDRCSQFPNENILSGDDLLIIEAAMNKSMTNH